MGYVGSLLIPYFRISDESFYCCCIFFISITSFSLFSFNKTDIFNCSLKDIMQSKTCRARKIITASKREK